MENNKILIGAQFTYYNDKKELKHINIELYVIRDIFFVNLIQGIGYGIKKLSREGNKDSKIYEKCYGIFKDCFKNGEIITDKDGNEYNKKITLTSYDYAVAKNRIYKGKRALISTENYMRPICDLGFITSTRVIFDTTGTLEAKGQLREDLLTEAFDPGKSEKIFFPEYNISSRCIYQFDKNPVEIIAPTAPPNKPEHGLFYMLMPSLVTIGIMIIVRMVMISSGTGSGLSMIILSVAMGITAVITTAISFFRQRADYKTNLTKWKKRYQNYVDSIIAGILDRQKADAKKMDELYPDITSIIAPDKSGVYSLNENIYSRSPGDLDYLSFRLGNSDYVENMFEIKGAGKEEVFSPAFFDFSKIKNEEKEVISIHLREEKGVEKTYNLSALPGVLSKRYRYMKNAPFLCSLKKRGAIGIVDRNINDEHSKAYHIVSRMIFELCYYHSPEDLQFVIFFKESRLFSEIEEKIQYYKYMPHFRGLFSDKSQFVTDSESANLVMSSLLSIMNVRRDNSNDSVSTKLPNIIMIVFEEHGLKEHAFAEYLPKNLKEESDSREEYGLTFVYAMKHKEYLPPYCDYIINLDAPEMSVTKRNDSRMKTVFSVPGINNGILDDKSEQLYTERLVFAFRFLAAVYFAKIAQNGKVPSNVSMMEMLDKPNANSLNNFIIENWGYSGNIRTNDATKSLKVPLGKNDTGTTYLDLHEKGDGPHMLVAGTTGSGKTETIITYLLLLCTYFRPDEINLLLVDMKGGGFTKRIGHLPHVVGAVTDVDGDENGTGPVYMLRRFLDAMRAEIRRRKVLFNKLHVDSIDAYIEACRDIESFIRTKKLPEDEVDGIKKTAKNDPLAHLFLVVDEFTELKRFSSENNDIDFIGEITTIARVGRSLGFHIILISQNIEGAITDDIRVNSRARLCLKVATKQASKEMLGSDVAASPYMPGNGRGYLLVGTGSRFEYFQSGYSGGTIETEVPIEITLASKTGQYLTFYRSDKDNTEKKEQIDKLKQSGEYRTQLEILADSICEVYKEYNSNVPRQLYLPPLPPRIYMEDDGTVIELEDIRE